MCAIKHNIVKICAYAFWVGATSEPDEASHAVIWSECYPQQLRVVDRPTRYVHTSDVLYLCTYTAC
jgi:hypothetical protein